MMMSKINWMVLFITDHVHQSREPEAYWTRFQRIDPQLIHGVHKRAIDTTLEEVTNYSV